jgi:hypothetical protein
MPVNIISHAKNPRRPISSIGSVIKVFAHKEEDFPELKKVIPSATVRALAKQIRVPSTKDLLGGRQHQRTRRRSLTFRNFPKFMKLPTEIRELVQEEAMLAGGHFTYDLFIQDHISSNPQRPRFLPALCSVSKALYSESAQVFLRHAKVVISNYAANLFMCEFLNHVQGFSSIWNIALPYFDYFPGVGNTKDGHLCEKNSDLALVSRCSGIHAVKITMGMKNLRN